jgi:hypothetical protein
MSCINLSFLKCLDIAKGCVTLLRFCYGVGYHCYDCTLSANKKAPACCVSSLGSNPDISQKYKMGDISKGVANTVKLATKIVKNYLL